MPIPEEDPNENNFNDDQVNSTTESEQQDTTVQTSTEASTSTIIVVTLVAFVAMIGDILPSHTVWVLMNQYQLYLLIPFMGVHVPQSLLYYITGQDFTLNALKFLGIQFLADVEIFGQVLGHQQHNQGMRDIQFEDGSMLVSCQNSILLLLAAILVHTTAVIAYHALKRCKVRPKITSQLKKYTTSVFMLSFYALYFLETFLLFMINTTNEIYASNENHSVSLVFAAGFNLWCSLGVLYFIYHYTKWREYSKSMLKVLYADVKNNKYSQMYSILFLIHRYILAA